MDANSQGNQCPTTNEPETMSTCSVSNHLASQFINPNSVQCSEEGSGNSKSLMELNQSKPSLENLFEDEDDDAIDMFPYTGTDLMDKSDLYRHSRKQESCSSYSSLNNDECSASLYSQESVVNAAFSGRMNVNVRPASNYPRKYSLTVPGEPRHMRTLHRRESGSRSPLNSSCGGLSHSELSTPSPSCSNSM